MFLPGTKLVIVESSVKKKATGIKQGSLCNLIESQQTIFSHSCNAVVTYCSALFTRYGFEKPKGRLERRGFINIFPIVMNSKITTEKVDRHINKVIKNSQESLCHECDVDFGTPIVVAHPVMSSGIDMQKDREEFDSWFHAVMMSGLIGYTINLDRLDAHYKKFADLNSDDFIGHIRSMARSKNKRLEYLEMIRDNDHGFKTRLIKRLMSMISITSRKYAGQTVNSMKHFISGKRRVGNEEVFTSLVTMYYNNSIKTIINIPTKDVNKVKMNNTVITGHHIRGLSHRTLGLLGDNQETKGDK